MTGTNYENYSVFSQILSEIFVSDALREMEEYSLKHDFSFEFERKMNKLIKKQKRPYYSFVSTASRRAACVGTAALIAGGTAMSVDAVRKAVTGFVAEHFNEHDEFSVIIDSIYPYPETVETEYSVDVPEGFVLDDEVSLDTSSCLIRSYKNNKNYIVFFQYTVKGFDSKINNEKSSVEYYTDNNGILYTIYRWDEKEGNYNVLWQKNGYVFQLNSDLSRNEVIEICVSADMKRAGGLK